MSLEQLTVLNLPPGGALKNITAKSLIVRTCQRTIVATIADGNLYDKEHEVYSGSAAYHFLLEVICGLKSKVIAEYEIVSQFKDAYHQYLTNSPESKDGNLIKIIEKIFKDSKEIRTKYLLEISHESYAGIAKKILKKQIATKTKAKLDMTILGSGKLAEDIIKNCTKNYNIHVIARNKARLEDLKSLYQVNVSILKPEIHFHTDAYIINTIGASNVLFDDENFFQKWQESHTERFFLDLGSPSTVTTTLRTDQAVFLLADFFEFAEKMSLEKKRKIELAKIAIEAIVRKRELLISKNWKYHLPEWNEFAS